MEVHVPEEIRHYEGELRFFMELMVWKLHTSRHKGFTDSHSLADLCAGFEREAEEMYLALRVESQFDVVVEAADVANQAFLLGLAALRKTKIDYKKEQTEHGQRFHLVPSSHAAPAESIHRAEVGGGADDPDTKRRRA